MANMGLDYATQRYLTCKRKFRWTFNIEGVVGDNQARLLPPFRSARPSLQFKTMEIRHATENIYYPMKPEWRPINLTLYDVVSEGAFGTHPVFEWIKKCYSPKEGAWFPVSEGFIRNAYVSLFDGCGNLLEKWVFEESWPEDVNFQTLDMADQNLVTCDITLRYNRAYLDNVI